MARIVKAAAVPVSAGPVRTCGECALAYGFCRPGADGTPIFCRCPGEVYLRMCSDMACDRFERRAEDAPPPEVCDVLSEILHAECVPKRRVPLFRPGEREPWKWVDSDDIPPEGISWDGSPFTGAPEVAPASGDDVQLVVRGEDLPELLDGFVEDLPVGLLVKEDDPGTGLEDGWEESGDGDDVW